MNALVQQIEVLVVLNGPGPVGEEVRIQRALVAKRGRRIHAPGDVNDIEIDAEVLEESMNLLERQAHVARVERKVVRSMCLPAGPAFLRRVEKGPKPFVGGLTPVAVNNNGLVTHLPSLILGLAPRRGEARTELVNDEVVGAGQGQSQV